MKLLVLVLLQLFLLAPSSANDTATDKAKIQEAATILADAIQLWFEVSNGDLISWRMTDVVYDTDGANVTRLPPEAMNRSSVANDKCQQVVKKVTLTKATQVDQRWCTGAVTTDIPGGSITAVLPFVSAAGISFSNVTTKQFAEATTVSETITQSVTMEMNIPPKHVCSATMMVYKYELKIPYTAFRECVTKTREYRHATSGAYESVQVGDVRAVVDRCEPIPNATPCP